MLSVIYGMLQIATLIGKFSRTYFGKQSMLMNLELNFYRFFVRMTDELLGKNVPSEDSLADSVSKSRAACKMRYLVGSAPVCYGVPVHL